MINTIDPRWTLPVDDREVQVAIRRHLLHGPYVRVNGQTVEAVQEPTWGRRPATPERHYRFQVGDHAAEIIEHHTVVPLLGPSLWGWYGLHLDGQPVEWHPPS